MRACLFLLILALQPNISLGEPSSQNKKHYLLIGGSGEPDSNFTSFDGEYINTLRYLRDSKDTEKTFSFDGEYARIEDLGEAYKLEKLTRTKGTAKEIINSIEKLKAQIERGEIKKGDQLIIHISSHGTYADSKEFSHSISIVSDTKNNIKENEILSEAEAEGDSLSLDRLQGLIKAAQAKGINLGIIDTSCYSGNVLKFANDTTCVITGSNDKETAKVGFAIQITQFQPGRTFEDVFLNLEKGYGRIGNPLISTAAGKAAKEQMKILESYYADANNQFKNSIKTDNECSYSTASMPAIDLLSKTMNSVLTAQTKTSALEEAVKNYQQEFDKAKYFYNFIVNENNKLANGLQKPIAWISLENFDVEARIRGSESYLNSLIESNDTAKIENKKKEIEQLKSFISIKERIINSPEFRAYVDHKKSYKQSIEKLEKLALEIKKAEGPVFNELYKKYDNGQEKNACKNIVL